MSTSTYSDLDAAVEQAFDTLSAKLDTLTPRPYAPSEPFALSLLRAAGAELQQASQALQQAAEALKFASKLKDANVAIKASRRAREAAQGLL